MHQSRPFKLPNSSGPALVGGSLFTPEKSKEEIQERKAKIKLYELNQYNPYTIWNSVNAKPVF
jgi:hypothetical protein